MYTQWNVHKKYNGVNCGILFDLHIIYIKLQFNKNSNFYVTVDPSKTKSFSN